MDGVAVVPSGVIVVVTQVLGVVMLMSGMFTDCGGVCDVVVVQFVVRRG